jgi:hypothetical protein
MAQRIVPADVRHPVTRRGPIFARIWIDEEMKKMGR